MAPNHVEISPESNRNIKVNTNMSETNLAEPT